MISAALFAVVQCPDCGGALAPEGSIARCAGCGREFPATGGYLDLRPREAFAEQTKYLDEALHADARHASVAPPLLGSKIRNDMLRRFLRLGPGDRAIDLGCGSGRAMAWNATSGASLTGIDISAHFAAEAMERLDLVLGDLRRLPFRDGAFSKAWSLDVLEHLSPAALGEMLAEANRVLEDGGGLFIYTHVRKNGWSARLVRLVNRLAAWLERRGLVDLGRERLRKSDHLNPLADHDELARVLGERGFRVERVTYYTPVIGAFVENILVRLAEKRLARRAAGRTAGSDEDALRAARSAAQARLRRGGAIYLAVRALSSLMMLDVVLFGRVKSGPFFALLRKVGPARVRT
jgi:SAM-dependent methyltransferase